MPDIVTSKQVTEFWSTLVQTDLPAKNDIGG